MNVVILTGRLTADPELRYTKSGVPGMTVNLAVDRSKNETDFPTIVMWRETAERACQYLHKGSKVVIRGELHTRTYEDVQTGQNHKVTEVHADRWEFADSKPQGPFA